MRWRRVRIVTRRSVYDFIRRCAAIDQRWQFTVVSDRSASAMRFVYGLPNECCGHVNSPLNAFAVIEKRKRRTVRATRGLRKLLIKSQKKEKKGTYSLPIPIPIVDVNNTTS